MPKFFVDKLNIRDNIIILDGENGHHISKVLRYRVDDEIDISDNEQFDYKCKIIDFTKDTVVTQVLEKNCHKTEPSCKAILFQALVKSDKMDSIIQKSVELGVSEIYPIMTNRCVAKIDEKKIDTRTKRYNKIALEAAKQSGRGKIPIVHKAIGFKEAINICENIKNKAIFYESIDTGLIKNKSSVEFFDSISGDFGFIIGSEGGFDFSEIEYAYKHNIDIVSLGSRILRAETAPSTVLSIYMFKTNNL